ncbi:MAG: DNA polymerase I [Pirellulaceae bacterium]|nr:DNA polymerase I [Pirellulaceae bacterium]
MSKLPRQRRLVGFEDEPEFVVEAVKGPLHRGAKSPVEPESQQSAAAEATPPTHSENGVSFVPPQQDNFADSPHDALTSEPVPVVFVVDAYNLIFQVFHALPEMTSPSGEPVGAVHGFLRDIAELIENHRADYLFCVFDSPGDTFRHQLYAGYKGEREEMPADLQPQIPKIRQMLEALGIPVLELSGFEADDIIATLAREIDRRGWQGRLVTSDKDCRQLITDRVTLFNLRRNKSQVYDAAALAEDWGVRPDQVVDFQALVGDAIDSVPGISLIGPKIASQLLQKYSTLEGVLDHADEVSGQQRRKNLANGRETALLSRQLVRLVDDVPLEIDWEAGRVSRFDPRPVLELCREFGFRRLADRLALIGKVEAGTGEGEKEAGLFEQAGSLGYVETGKADYRTVATREELQALVLEMAAQPQICLDTETTSTNPCWAEIVGYSFAWQPGVAYYIPVRSPSGEPALDPAFVAEQLAPVLENPKIGKIGQNIKYDMIVLRSAGIRLQGLAFDTMVADYLIDPGERNHSLDDLAKRYLDHDTIKIHELIGTGKNQKRMDEVPVALVTAYAAEDADITWQLREPLENRLEKDGLLGLFRDLEIPLIEVLVELECNGIKVNAARLEELGQRFGQRIERLEQEIYELAGHPFNIDSRQQLGKILFEDLKLPVVKKTKTGPSTDVEVLTELAKQHELPARIVEYRQSAKLKSTYVDGLIQLIHPVTGRVHTSFKQDVAATGRLSSQEPNLQNIPVRTAEGREIRSAFVPGQDDWKLLTADYSQIELRVLAHFCGDEALKKAFADDQDIHALVASEVHGVPLDQVTSEMRRKAKAVNFGVIYGQSAFGLAKSLDIDKKEAGEFIEAYFARYPGVDQFMLETLAECRRRGYVSTILGRRRAVQGVREISSLSDSRQRNLPERIAVNTVIQGSAADLIKKAMIHVHRRIHRDRLKARMLLQIHDELIFEAPADQIEHLAEMVRQEMSSVGNLAVPLKVDVKVGDNWAQCEAWT